MPKKCIVQLTGEDRRIFRETSVEDYLCRAIMVKSVRRHCVMRSFALVLADRHP